MSLDWYVHVSLVMIRTEDKLWYLSEFRTNTLALLFIIGAATFTASVAVTSIIAHGLKLGCIVVGIMLFSLLAFLLQRVVRGTTIYEQLQRTQPKAFKTQ